MDTLTGYNRSEIGVIDLFAHENLRTTVQELGRLLNSHLSINETSTNTWGHIQGYATCSAIDSSHLSVIRFRASREVIPDDNF